MNTKYRVVRMVAIIAAAILTIVASAAQSKTLPVHVSWPEPVPVAGPPGGANEEICARAGDKYHKGDAPELTSSCSLSKAVVTFDGVPRLSLEGSFCEDPEVLIGIAGGIFERLFVIGASDNFIETDLGPWTDPATRLVIVRCPCSTCAMDVTVGATGPTGPEGPAGPPGPPGALPPGSASALRVTVRATEYVALGNDMQCVKASCSGGEVVTGGGYATWDLQGGDLPYGVPDWDPPYAALGFEPAFDGPLDFYILDDVPDPPDNPDCWTVCGRGPGLLLSVYAVCANSSLPICGDGNLSPPEQCETDGDCASFGPYAQCADCTCTNYCGDGVVTPPEQCESRQDCQGFWVTCENCECVYDGANDPGDG